MLSSKSDEELATLVQRKDEEAFTILMERYTSKLLRYGNRLIPSENNVGDIVQDIFVTVYQNIQDFDSTRRFSSWIYRIAHNAFIDTIRKRNKGPIYLFDFDKVIPHPTYEDPSTKEKEVEETHVLLKKGLEGLSHTYKEIIDLYYFEDFSYKEISDILHIPIGTVGIRLSRAREALKNKLPEQNYE